MRLSYPADYHCEKYLDVLAMGGGGGNPYITGSLQDLYPGISLASIVNAADNGGHTGKLRTEYPGGLLYGNIVVGIAAAGDAVKSLGSTATTAGYDLSSLKHRNEDGSSVGNLRFLDHFRDALKKGQHDPNQAALDSLAQLMGSAPVYFATEPAQLVMSKDGQIIESGETQIAESMTVNPISAKEVLQRDFGVMAHSWQAPILSRPLGAIMSAKQVILSPSHPISSTAAVIAPLKQLGPELRDAISAKTTLVIGTENPWNMQDLTIADYLALLEKVSGISPANVAIGESLVETGDLPPSLQHFIQIRNTPNLPRLAENGNPLETHKPKSIYPPEFAGKLLETIYRYY